MGRHVANSIRKENSRGKKGKKRLREINTSGDSKQGSDMDAFPTEQESVNAETDEPKNDGPTSATVETKVTPTVDTKKPVSTATSNGPESVVESESKPEQPAKADETPGPVPESNDVGDEKVEENNENKDASAEESSDGPLDENKPVIKKNKSTELKYKYRENQWSPLNPEGKKQYDRSFLLQLQSAPESLEKPAGLPKLPDVILDTPISTSERSFNPPARIRVPPDFTPGFVKSSPSGKGGPIGKRNSAQKPGRGMGMGGGHKVIQHTMGSTEVKLHNTENKWKPNSEIAKTATPDDTGGTQTEDLYKKVNAILNKLTPQKFQTLIQQVLELEIDTEERIAGCIDIIFEKAISEPNFSVAYGNMCKYMINMKVPSKDKPEEFVTFKRLLLNRCQKEFEKDKAEENDMVRRQTEIDEAPEDKKKQLIKKKKVPTATLR